MDSPWKQEHAMRFRENPMGPCTGDVWESHVTLNCGPTRTTNGIPWEVRGGSVGDPWQIYARAMAAQDIPMGRHKTEK